MWYATFNWVDEAGGNGMTAVRLKDVQPELDVLAVGGALLGASAGTIVGFQLRKDYFPSYAAPVGGPYTVKDSALIRLRALDKSYVDVKVPVPYAACFKANTHDLDPLDLSIAAIITTLLTVGILTPSNQLATSYDDGWRCRRDT